MRASSVSELLSLWRELSFRIKLGFVLVALAQVFLGSILLVPFLEAELSTKGFVSLGLFVIGEILFYSGLFLLGKEIVSKYRNYFNPMYWLKRKKKEEEQ